MAFSCVLYLKEECDGCGACLYDERPGPYGARRARGPFDFEEGPLFEEPDQEPNQDETERSDARWPSWS